MTTRWRNCVAPDPRASTAAMLRSARRWRPRRQPVSGRVDARFSLDPRSIVNSMGSPEANGPAEAWSFSQWVQPEWREGDSDQRQRVMPHMPRWIQAESTASEARVSLGRWMFRGPYSGGITVGEEAVCVPHGWPFACGPLARSWRRGIESCSSVSTAMDGGRRPRRGCAGVKGPSGRANRWTSGRRSAATSLSRSRRARGGHVPEQGMRCGLVCWADAAAIGYHRRWMLMRARCAGMFIYFTVTISASNCRNSNLPP